MIDITWGGKYKIDEKILRFVKKMIKGCRFRVKETEKGILMQEKTLLGWRTCLTYRGTEDPYYFSTNASAVEALLDDLRFQIQNVWMEKAEK